MVEVYHHRTMDEMLDAIDLRMDEERARIERRRRHREAYAAWRDRLPWRWIPADLRRRLWKIRVERFGLPKGG